MLGLVSQVKHDVRATARSAEWAAVGAVFALVALAFMTIALWLLLAAHEGILFATTTIGVIYAAAAAICLAVGLSRAAPGDRGTDAEEEFRRQPLVQIAEGFAIGMQAGRAARSDRDRM